MKITNIYPDIRGVTHFGEINIPLINKGDIGSLSEIVEAEGIIFRETESDYNYSSYRLLQVYNTNYPLKNQRKIY